ncbi:MAG: hypothetical protein ACREC3_13390, partial [Methyloceanibacter sp.]
AHKGLRPKSPLALSLSLPISTYWLHLASRYRRFCLATHARFIMLGALIMRAFVQLRQMLSTHADLARKLAALEKKYDAQFKAVFDAIRELMKPLEPLKKRRIGFISGD